MGGAYAQSSVTLFGVVDAAVERTSTSGVSKTTLVQGANSSSRLGFRGTEDLGAGEFKASYVPYKSDNSALKGNQFAVGYVYNLSKRTAVYTTYARLSNTGSSAVISSFGQTSLGASPSFGQSINGFDIGLRHSF